MKTDTGKSDDDFVIQKRSAEELLQFAMQLAAPCNHCALKAQIALASAKLLCMEDFFRTDDQRFSEPAYILSAAIIALESLDEAEDEDEQEEDEPANNSARSHLH